MANLLDNFKKLVGNEVQGAKSVAQGLGSGVQGLRDVVSLGIPGAAQGVLPTALQGIQNPKLYTQGDPQPSPMGRLLQQINQFQPIQPKPYIGMNGQPIQQWNPSMGGAPLQNYMNSPSHSPIPSFIGNQYAQSNAGPQFTGQNAVDPMIFGYPPDNGVY